jgi:site-specific recombinase XerD
MEDWTICEVWERFQVFNRAANKSQKTLEWYDTGISRYHQYLCEQLHREPTVADIDLLSVRAFIVMLQEKKVKSFSSASKPLSSETINSYVRALRSFTHFLYEEGITQRWILEKLKPPKVELKLKDVVEPEDIKRIFAAFNQRTFLGSRNIAMIALFLDGGLRLSELTGLKIEDCNFSQGYVKVFGKGRKERIIGISDEVITAIPQYLKFRPLVVDCPYLFLTIDEGQMTKNSVEMIFTRLRKKLGLPKLHAHLLRHASATMHLMNGEDLVTLQRQMGHSHITVTQQYIGNIAGAQVKAHRDMSPWKSMGIKLTDRKSRGARSN